MTGQKIIVALDYSEPASAIGLAEQLDPKRCRLKVGKELFTRAGPAIVRDLQARGFDIFLDLKFHDIPNTVANACRVAADLGVWMMNVHAQGGRKMLEAARAALETSSSRPLLIGVTILTSLAEEDLKEIGVQGSVLETVARLAALTKDAGLDGVVCSPLELPMLRATSGEDFLLVTPGIRPKGAASGDQKRVMTPREAIVAGASYIVVGRPITAVENPLAALTAIERELEM